MAARKPPQRKRRKQSVRQPWYVRWFSVIAVVIIASLVFGTLGVAVFDDWFSRSDGENEITVDPEDVSETEQRYLDFIEEDPNDFAAMNGLAGYYGASGRYQEAVFWYERALSIVPNDMSIRLDFAQTLAQGAMQRDAELQYKRVIEAEPDNFQAILGLARLYRDWSPPRPADAAVLYQDVIDRAEPGSLVVQLAQEEIALLTGTPVASPAASPVASPEGSPAS